MTLLAEIASLRWMSERQFWLFFAALSFCAIALAYCQPPVNSELVLQAKAAR